MLNVILDIGANDGSDGLGYALFNPNLKIYAFEPNPELISKINKNKEKIEKIFNVKLSNYKIVNKAVSNFNGTSDFYLSELDLCSSLLKYKFVKMKKKIACEVITLEKFCSEEKIDNIVFLHVDTQGSDLDVLKGLKFYKSINISQKKKITLFIFFKLKLTAILILGLSDILGAIECSI